MTEPQNIQSSGRNTQNTLPQQQPKLGQLKLQRNPELKRINLMEFKQNVQRELDAQKRKLDQMQNKNNGQSDEYFSNVYGPLTHKLNSIKMLRDIMQRNKQFDECNFAIGCPCFHHRHNSKQKKLFADFRWYNGKSDPAPEREMMVSQLEGMTSSMYDDVPIDEKIIIGEVTPAPPKKKKGKMNMLRERFNEILFDSAYPDIEKKYRLAGVINKPTKGKIAIFSFFEIEAGDIMNFEFENKGVLTGKQMMNKVDYKEMSQFCIELTLIEQDTVQDFLKSPELNDENKFYEKYKNIKEFVRQRQSHFNISLIQKQRDHQYSYDAIQLMKQLKDTDPNKLFRILTTYDPIHCESIISLTIITRDIGLLNFIFSDILTDTYLTSQEMFLTFVSTELIKGFQKVSLSFEKDKKFYLEFQKKLVESTVLKVSDFFGESKDESSSSDTIFIRKQLAGFSKISTIMFDDKKMPQIEFCSALFKKMMKDQQMEERIESFDLFLDYYRDQYFTKFILPDTFENNQYQSIFFGNSIITGGRTGSQKFNNDVRYYNILHHFILNKKNVDDIIRRYNETYILFYQKDQSGNTPAQYLFRHGKSEQIIQFIKVAGLDSVQDLRNNYGENILHSLVLNKNIGNIEEVIQCLGKETIDNLKNSKNNYNQYPILYFLKNYLKSVKFPILQLLIPQMEQKGDIANFIRNDVLPILNACILNTEVTLFLMNRISYFNLIYQYPPAIMRFIDYKTIFEKLMTQLIEDNICMKNTYHLLDLKQIQWIVDRDRSFVKFFIDYRPPLYDLYVRKKQDNEQQSFALDNNKQNNNKLKKKLIVNNILPLYYLKLNQITEEVMKMVEFLPKYPINKLINDNDLTWSNKVFNPNQDKEIRRYFKGLFSSKIVSGQKVYTSFSHEDYKFKKYFIFNPETYEAKKKVLFGLFQRLEKKHIFYFKQTSSPKFATFIKDLDGLGFKVIVEIKSKPFVRYLSDSPIIKKEKWFLADDEFKKIMTQKYCNHLTNIPFSIARDDKNLNKFQELLQNLLSTPYGSESLLDLFYYHIIEANAIENFKLLSEYYFNEKTVFRWCRELKISISTQMIQVILDKELIPHNRICQFLCFKRYNLKKTEYNIFANLETSQIQIEEDDKNVDNNQKNAGGKAKLIIPRLIFDLICTMAKLRNFNKNFEWANFFVEWSFKNQSCLSQQNKRYILGQNWPDLWAKISDPDQSCLALLIELHKKQKEKVQYKISTSQTNNNNKNNQLIEKKSTIVSNKEYIKKCIDFIVQNPSYQNNRRQNITARIAMLCINLGKQKWASKIISTAFLSQNDLFPLFRYFSLDYQVYKQMFVINPFGNKDKSQLILMDNLKNLGEKNENYASFSESLTFLKKIERNESFSQIQQWIQRCSEEQKYTCAVFLLERYIGVLISMFDNPAQQTPRKFIKKNEESLLSEKYIKKQQEYAQKLALLQEKNKNQQIKFKKDHSYNLINLKEDPNRLKYLYGIKFPAGKCLKSLFGQQISFSINVFQMEQLVETCIEILHRKEEYTKKKQLDTQQRRWQVCRYMIQKPERIIGIIQKMKYGGHAYIKMIFNNMKIRMNKKFNENIDYLSSKLIIKEYISAEKANKILQSSLQAISLANNNSIIAQISKIYGKEVIYNQLKQLKQDYYKNILPAYLIEFKNWLMKEDQKGGVKKSKPSNDSGSLNIGGYDESFDSAPKKQSPEQQKQQAEESIEIEYEECPEYHFILLELAQREAMKIKLQKQSKKSPTDGKVAADISQFQSDLLNFELSSIITERDLKVKIISQKKSDMIFAEYLLSKGLLFKNEQVDDRLIKAIDGKTQALKFVIQSQDSVYAKAVFDKFFQGKRSLVEQFMDDNQLFFDMIKRGSKEDFIDRMLSYYYRKNAQSLQLVELAIQNNMQKVFFSLIRSESDRNSIKQLIQNQYQYIKAFKHYDILNFALTELEIRDFIYAQHSDNIQPLELYKDKRGYSYFNNSKARKEKLNDQENDSTNTFLLQCTHVNWISMKLLLLQDGQVETLNKTQKMFYYLKQVIIQNPLRFPNGVGKEYHLNFFIQLSQLVFERRKDAGFKSDFLIIQSEIIKEYNLFLLKDVDEQKIQEIKMENPKVDEGYINKKYTSVYGRELRQIIKKPYQLMYWLKYRHNQQHFQINQEDEQFILKVREIVNKYGFVIQQEFSPLQKSLGLINEAWLFEDHLKYLDIQLHEDYIFQILNSLNPQNHIFFYYVFNYAIMNSSLFIRLLPKIYAVYTPQQIEEILALIVQLHIKKRVFRLDPKISKLKSNQSASKPGSQLNSPRGNSSQIQNKSQFAGASLKELSPINAANKISESSALDIQGSKLNDQMKTDSIESAADVNENNEQNLFSQLKLYILQMFSRGENFNFQEEADQLDQNDNPSQNYRLRPSLVKLQNTLITLIKQFDSNYYSKIVCDNFDHSYILKNTEEWVFDIKFMTFILNSAADQNAQINCIKRLCNKYNINLKNCVDIKAFQSIAQFYFENLKPLYSEPYNVKRIEIICGNQNKYQYFSSQNLLITFNNCNQQEFEAFKYKEFEISEQVDYQPFKDVKLQFKLKVSSKNFSNSQTKTNKAIEYFQNQFQQEISEDEEYLRDWCEYLSYVQQCRKQNIDLFANHYKDKPNTSPMLLQKQSKNNNDMMDSLLKDNISESNTDENKQEQQQEENEEGVKTNRSQFKDIGSNLLQTEIIILAKEVSSTEYMKLFSPYERVKNMNNQLFLEKELKDDNQYNCYFFFDGSKLRILNTFYTTNIAITKMIKQTSLQIPTTLEFNPTISVKDINNIIQKSENLIDFDYVLDFDTIKSEKNELLIEQYCRKYLRQELFTCLKQSSQSCQETLENFLQKEMKIQFKCIEGNEQISLKEQEKIKKTENDTAVYIIGFDFSQNPIKITNCLIIQIEKYLKEIEQIRDYEPVFLTQYHSIFEVFNYKIVIDFITYFNTITMNCSQLKLMFTNIPDQILKAMKIISQNSAKYGFKYVMFSFTTTNQPFQLKSDCFKDSNDKLMRFGQTTYEIIKPFEDADSSKFKLQSTILKVTLSLAFKYAAKEITAQDKKEDDTESYFYKVTNEYELIKSVCSYREILRKLFVNQEYSSKKQLFENNDNNETKENQEEGSSQIKEESKPKMQDELRNIFDLSKFESIIGQIFENNQKPGNNDIGLLYKQAFDRMKQMEVYFLLYSEIDLNRYKNQIYDEKYQQYLLSLLTKQDLENTPNEFRMLQKIANKYVQQNQSKFDKDILKKLYQQFNVIGPQEMTKNLSYRFYKEQFQVVYPEPKTIITQANTRMLDMKNQISTILKDFNIYYKNEDKWSIQQWNAIIESCEGFSNAMKTTKLNKYCKNGEKYMKGFKSDKLFYNVLQKSLIVNQGGIVDKNDQIKLQFNQYFQNIQLSINDSTQQPQLQQNQSKKQKPENIKVQFKNIDESNEENILQLEILNISDNLRQESCLNVYKALVNLLKSQLTNQSFAPQQEHSKNKILRITVSQDEEKETFFKFKKKPNDMSQNELIQTYYLITQINTFKQLAIQVKKQIKIVYQYGLKKPQIIENSNYYKIRLSSFYNINIHQLVLNDVNKPIVKCGLYSINSLKLLKNETIVDVTVNLNWEIQALFEISNNKYTYKNIDIKDIQLDPNGSIIFKHDDNNSQNQPLIIKYYYKKDHIAAYIQKS